MVAVKNCYRGVGFHVQQTIPARNFRHLIRFDSKQKRIYMGLCCQCHFITHLYIYCPAPVRPCAMSAAIWEIDPCCLNDTLVAFHYFICLLSHFSATIPTHLSFGVARRMLCQKCKLITVCKFFMVKVQFVQPRRWWRRRQQQARVRNLKLCTRKTHFFQPFVEMNVREKRHFSFC